jgi:hypothetical protein
MGIILVIAEIIDGKLCGGAAREDANSKEKILLIRLAV